LEGEFPGKNSLDASIFRGSIVYTNYCVLCHGIKGDGHGRAARLYDPKPANLVLSDKNPQYKELIIRRGGKALGRSQFMPPWGQELTDEQVTDVVTFLGSIVAKDK
jgi:mono/diheme cytochrome c family protein